MMRLFSFFIEISRLFSDSFITHCNNILTASEWRVGVGLQVEDTGERFRGITAHDFCSESRSAASVDNAVVVQAAVSDESGAVH